MVCSGCIILEVPILSLCFTDLYTKDVCSIIVFSFQLFHLFGLSFLCLAFCFNMPYAFPAFYIDTVFALFTGINLGFQYYQVLLCSLFFLSILLPSWDIETYLL